MKVKVATVALLCAALIPHAALAQGSTNPNDCSISPSGGSASGDITVEGTAEQFGQTVTLYGASVTFPTTLANDPVVDAYNSGAFGLVPGFNDILTEVTVVVDTEIATSEGSQPLVREQFVTVDIVDPDLIPGNGDEYLADLPAAVSLPNSNWSPTELTINFTQTVFIAMSGGIIIDCEPASTPIPFETLTVVTDPCNDVGTCNFPNGQCDFWGSCECFGDFGGPSCACSDSGTCSGNGFCDATGACVCTDPAWEGPTCSDPTCDPVVDCNSNGTCEAGQCVCGPGYTGDDCSTEICVPGVNCTSVPVGFADLLIRLAPVPGGSIVDGSTINWRNQEFSVFGLWPINLGLVPDINPMTVPTGGGIAIHADPGTDPASGTFTALYLSEYLTNPGYVFSIDGEGDFVCPNNVAVCGVLPGDSTFEGTFVTTTAAVTGTVVDDVGPGTLPTTIGGAPVSYVLDGALQCWPVVGGSQCTGTGYLSAFVAENTPVGMDVPVEFEQIFIDPSDPSGQTLVPVNATVIFDEVVDTGTPANTTLVTTSQAAGSISSDFELELDGMSVIFLDITTTADFNDDVTVCLEYSDTFANECDLRLLHNDDAPPNEFQDATLGEAHEDCPFPDGETTCENNLCINTVINRICGGATSLSPWVLAEYVGNEAPIADAGPDQPVTLVGTVVHLDGRASYDPEGDALTYQWTLSAPAGSTAMLTVPAPPDDFPGTAIFTPDVYGDYTATLIVTDSNGLPSTPDEMTVSFDNLPPVADAGPHQAVRVGDAVLLAGSGTDPNNDVLTYRWSLFSQPVGSTAALNDLTLQTPTFTPDLAGTYEIHLTVNDGLLDSETATVSVVATTAEGDLVEKLEQAIDAVNALDAAVFKNVSLQKNMAKHIGQALAHVDNGKFNAARDKLEAVLRKTDGCANGSSPDPNDWIVDCGAQSQVHPLIVQAIALIDEILGQ